MKEKLDKSANQLDRSQYTEELQKRISKLKSSEELLKMQTNKLFEAQKDFYNVLPKIHRDAQLHVIKSMVEVQGHLLHLVQYFSVTQTNSKSVFTKVNLLLNNAALNFLQSLREVSVSAESSSSYSSIATTHTESTMARMGHMLRYGVQGYELDLQTVLSDLLLQAKSCQQEIVGAESNNSRCISLTHTIN